MGEGLVLSIHEEHGEKRENQALIPARGDQYELSFFCFRSNDLFAFLNAKSPFQSHGTQPDLTPTTFQRITSSFNMSTQGGTKN